MTTTRRMTAVLAAFALTVLTAGWGGVPAQAQETPSATDTDYGRMLLVLDSSGSMKEPAGGGSTKIEAAKDALGRVVEELPEDADVGLRVFGAKVFSRDQKGACTDSQLVVEPGTDNREELLAAVADYEPYGETPIAYALQQAAQDIGSEGTRSIVLVSDGVATCQPDPCQVAADLAKRGIDLQIDVVGLSVDPKAKSQLRCVAAAGNGTYYDADSAEDIVDSVEVAAERAVDPFELDGEPARGGGDSTTATTVGAGRHVDRIGPGEERWYRYERTMDGSTVIASTYEMTQGLDSELSLDVVTESGVSCHTGYQTAIFPVFTTDGATVPWSSSEADEECTAGPLLFGVSSRASEGRVEFGLGIIEEPSVSNAADLPEGVPGNDSDRYEAPRASGPEVEVEAGTTFADATELTSGVTHTSSIVTGEEHAYKIHVGWGQKLAFRVTPRGGVDPLDFRFGVGIQLLNPARLTLSDSPEGSSTTLVPMTGGTMPVQWRNREVERGSGSFLAGDYYVLLSAPADREYGAEFPYAIEVEVQGEETGVPAYAEGAEPLGELSASGSSEADSTSAEQPGDSPAASGDDGQEESGATPRVLVASGLGLVAVGCLVVGALLLRRNRGSTVSGGQQ